MSQCGPSAGHVRCRLQLASEINIETRTGSVCGLGEKEGKEKKRKERKTPGAKRVEERTKDKILIWPKSLGVWVLCWEMGRGSKFLPEEKEEKIHATNAELRQDVCKARPLWLVVSQVHPYHTVQDGNVRRSELCLICCLVAQVWQIQADDVVQY